MSQWFINSNAKSEAILPTYIYIYLKSSSIIPQMRRFLLGWNATSCWHWTQLRSLMLFFCLFALDELWMGIKLPAGSTQMDGRTSNNNNKEREREESRVSWVKLKIAWDISTWLIFARLFFAITATVKMFLKLMLFFALYKFKIYIAGEGEKEE